MGDSAESNGDSAGLSADSGDRSTGGAVGSVRRLRVDRLVERGVAQLDRVGAILHVDVVAGQRGAAQHAECCSRAPMIVQVRVMGM